MADRLSQILAKLRKKDEAYPFLKPVDWKRLELDDYPLKIKNPMDLQTLGRQVRDGLFNLDMNQFIANLQLIWDNCKSYNDETTVMLNLQRCRFFQEVYEMAVEMERFAKELISDILTASPVDHPQLEEDDRRTAKRRRSHTLKLVSEDPVNPNRPIKTMKPATIKLSPERLATLRKIAKVVKRLNSEHQTAFVLALIKEGIEVENSGNSVTLHVDRLVVSDLIKVYRETYPTRQLEFMKTKVYFCSKQASNDQHSELLVNLVQELFKLPGKWKTKYYCVDVETTICDPPCSESHSPKSIVIGVLESDSTGCTLQLDGETIRTTWDLPKRESIRPLAENQDSCDAQRLYELLDVQPWIKDLVSNNPTENNQTDKSSEEDQIRRIQEELKMIKEDTQMTRFERKSRAGEAVMQLMSLIGLEESSGEESPQLNDVCPDV